MSLYEASVPQLKKMLGNVDQWLEKAQAHARKNSLDENALVEARLAPDQFALVRQVQTACDNAKFIAARLTGKTPPSHPDNEKTVDELRQRIRSVTSYLDGFAAKDFEGADKRPIELSFLEGKIMHGGDYLNEFALPNFYFHVVTTYSILRHNGLDLGKRDFIGGMTLHDR